MKDVVASYTEQLKLIEKFTKMFHHVILETELAKVVDLDINALDQWCEQNCEGEWLNSAFLFSFELESDAVAFKLRFK